MADDEPSQSTEKHSSHRRDRGRDHVRERDKDKDRSHRPHRHHHRSSHHHRSHSRSRDKDGSRDKDHDRDRRHHKKRTRRDDGEGSGSDRHHKSRRESSHKEKSDVPEPNATKLAEPSGPSEPSAKRDEWMVAPTADFIDYIQKDTRKSSPPKLAVQSDYRPVIYKNELNQQLWEGKSLDEEANGKNGIKEGNVGYTFGDSGTNWRMTRLKRCYEAALEQGVDLEVVALERYGDLRLLDDAREEELELERRELYGVDRKDMKEKPTGELWRERLQRRQEMEAKLEERAAQEQARVLDAAPPLQPAATTAKVVDQTTLNKMRAALMKAQLRGDPKAAKMEEEYNAAIEAARSAPKTDGVVVLSAMDTRQIAGLGGRVGREVVLGKKGKVVENEDMTLDDMLREEKITRGQGAGRQMAERISRDAKFDVSNHFLLVSMEHHSNPPPRTTWTTWMRMQRNWPSVCKRTRLTSKTWPSMSSRRYKELWIHVRCVSKTTSRQWHP